jgi:hypothetical protein
MTSPAGRGLGKRCGPREDNLGSLYCLSMRRTARMRAPPSETAAAVNRPATSANSPKSATSSTRRRPMPSRLTDQEKSCNRQNEIAWGYFSPPVPSGAAGGMAAVPSSSASCSWLCALYFSRCSTRTCVSRKTGTSASTRPCQAGCRIHKSRKPRRVSRHGRHHQDTTLPTPG